MIDNDQTIDLAHAGSDDGGRPAEDAGDATAAYSLKLINTLRRAAAAIDGIACLRLPLEGRKHPIDDDERIQLREVRAAMAAVLDATPPTATAQLAELLLGLTDISCHAVANLHPETTRDVPAYALDQAAAWIGMFYPNPQRADELARVWGERADLVRAFEERRNNDPSFRDPEPPTSPFPTAVAAGYLQSRQGNPGVFGGQHEIGTNREGQPVILQPVSSQRTGPVPAVPTGPTLSAAAERRLQQSLATLRATMAVAFGADTAGLDAYMRDVEAAGRGVVALTDGRSTRKPPTSRRTKAAAAAKRAAAKGTKKTTRKPRKRGLGGGPTGR